ncbi:hypothetical protein BH11MYX2_BH11MYX2_12750 [soil metagenome]
MGNDTKKATQQENQLANEKEKNERTAKEGRQDEVKDTTGTTKPKTN